jgi:hypothetical protein
LTPKGIIKHKTACFVAAALLSGGCASSRISATCPADVHYVFAPADTTIRADERFVAHATVLGCGGAEDLHQAITWHSDDSTIATIDVNTGVVTGVGTGQTNLWAKGTDYPMVRGTLVHVTR